ncbi:MAG: ribosome maturation factor RimP [Gordonia sp. (in: high G+C Gram-positive bacteria)]|uniref:ribosome maturation factor RimP n=1 Tax=Gordonia sp. (in: high G+C Gram-positive bacteria) TaxID=84139 RepID=UPI003BB71630
MAEMLIGQIEAVVEPLVVGLGYDLEGVEVSGSGARRDVRITVDRDGGASLDDIAAVSRSLSDAFDETDLFDDVDVYDLEVSTPGIGAPLTQPRHWRRARGRKVAVTRGDQSTGEQTVGRVADVDDDTVTLLHNDKGRMSTVAVPLADITRAVTEVDFTRPGPAELRRCGLDDEEIARRREPAS